MPIYEFKCKSCGAISEHWQKISDPYPSDCPQCHEGKLEKIMSTTGFALKGGGWYVTDFRENKSTSNTSATAPTSTPTASKEKKTT